MRNYKFVNFVLMETFGMKPSTSRIDTRAIVLRSATGDVEKIALVVTENRETVAVFDMNLLNRELCSALKKTYEYPFTEDYVKRIHSFLSEYFSVKQKKVEKRLPKFEEVLKSYEAAVEANG